MPNQAKSLNERMWEVWKTVEPNGLISAVLPPTVSGQLLNNDHTPASNVLIVVRRPEYVNDSAPGFQCTKDVPWPKPSAITSAGGGFVLALPSFPLPAKLFFDVIAKNQPVITFSVCGHEVLDGILGPIVLTTQLNSYCSQEARDLRSSNPLNMLDQFHHAIESASDGQILRIGDSNCAEQYYSQTGPLEEFPFGILFRLIEPNLFSLPGLPSVAPTIALASQPTLPPPPAPVPAQGQHAAAQPPAPANPQKPDPNASFLQGLVGAILKLVPAGKLITDLNPNVIETIVAGLLKAEKLTIDQLRHAITGIQLASPTPPAVPVKRSEINSPVSITSFKQQIAGWPGHTTDLKIPGTLGIGYALQCKQVWRQGGLVLGDLIYSLPLAPGEEQLIAVQELSVSTNLTLQDRTDITEAQHYSSAEDSSSNAVFGAAFNEAANQGSQYFGKSTTSGSGSSGGFSIPFLGGGGGASSSSETVTSGSFSASQNLNRNYASAAAQALSSAVSRSAAAARTSSRTVVSLSTKNLRQSVATKSIKNNNHCHALTVQYWEVLRQISVSTEVTGIQLVCLVPLELITFFTQQPDALQIPGAASGDFDFLTKRYHELIEYLDPIESVTPSLPTYQSAVRLLRELKFALTQGQLLKDARILTVTMTGNFLPQDKISITLATKSNGKSLTTTVVPPPIASLTEAQSVAQYIDILRQVRDSSTLTTLTANIQMPPDLGYSDLSSLSVTVGPVSPSWSISLKPSLPTAAVAPQTLAEIQDYVHGLTQTVRYSDIQGTSVTLSSISLTAELNNVNWPLLVQQVFPQSLSNGLLFSCNTESLPTAWTQQELANVEALYRYVLSNRVYYSRAVWRSLSNEEWAMILEGYAIQITNTDPGDKGSEIVEVPLLNCVANQLMGFEGNLAVFPLTLPIRQVNPDKTSVQNGLTHANLTQALLDLNMRTFRSMPSVITLPTHGMLGEAVLGMCNSCEKIDITRFWNWKDSPTSSSTPTISPVTLNSSVDTSLPTPQVSTPGAAGIVPGSIISINTGASGTPPSILSSIAASPDKLTGGAATNPTIQALQSLASQTESKAAEQAKTAMQTASDQSKSAMQNSKELTEKAMDTFKDLAASAAKIAGAAGAAGA